MTRDDAKGAARQKLALRLRPRGAEGVRGSTGYNHSIRYKNYLVHIQTEDAGARQAKVFTHVFIEGRVIATRRSSYADRLDAADLDAFVRRLVYEQHRSTFVALRDGEFDEALARTSINPDERTSGVVRRADATLSALSTSPPRAASRAPSSPSPAPVPPALTMVSVGLRALSPPIAPSFQRPISDAPFTGPTSGAWAAGLRLPSTTPPSPVTTPSRPSPTGPLTSDAPAAPVPPHAPSVKPRPHSLVPSVAPMGPGLRLPSTAPPKPGSLVPPHAPTSLDMPSTVPPSANRSMSTLPPALGLRSLLTSMPTVERPAPSPASGRGAATTAGATAVNATTVSATTRSEAPRPTHNSPSTAPRPSAPPPARAFSERPFAPLPLSLRVLDGYRASGVVDLASGKLLAFDGLVGAAALVTSLREVIEGQGRALAALAIEDNGGECLLLGASSCLLVRPLPSRPGAYLYLACDQIPADLEVLRAALASAADEIG